MYYRVIEILEVEGWDALLIKYTLLYQAITDILNHKSIRCKIFLESWDILVGGVCRPPSAAIAFLEEMEDFITLHAIESFISVIN